MFFSLYVPQKQDWNFSGPFGIYDKAQLRRGLKVYKKYVLVAMG